MTTFLSDTFTDTADTSILSHTGETGATWARNGGYPSGAATITDANRLRASVGAGVSVFYGSGTPDSADQTVTGTLYAASLTDGYVGVAGRMATATANFYWAIYNGAAGGWQLWKMVSGSITQLGSTYSQTLTAGVAYTLALDMAGTTIRMLVDGVERASVTDGAHSSAGKAGVLLYAPTTASNSTGWHLADIVGATAGGGGGSSIAVISNYRNMLARA